MSKYIVQPSVQTTVGGVDISIGGESVEIHGLEHASKQQRNILKELGYDIPDSVTPSVVKPIVSEDTTTSTSSATDTVHSSTKKEKIKDSPELYEKIAENRSEFIRKFGTNPFPGVTITQYSEHIDGSYMRVSKDPKTKYERINGKMTKVTIPGWFGIRKI